jgi:hypothetical protein
MASPPDALSRLLSLSVVEVLLKAAACRATGRRREPARAYIHDLSEVFPVELGPDGRFGYEKLPCYWSEPDRRFPFLITYDGRLAGFRARDARRPAVQRSDVFDVAEFFVLRRYRRLGVAAERRVLVGTGFRPVVRAGLRRQRRRSPVLDPDRRRVHGEGPPSVQASGESERLAGVSQSGGGLCSRWAKRTCPDKPRRLRDTESERVAHRPVAPGCAGPVTHARKRRERKRAETSAVFPPPFRDVLPPKAACDALGSAACAPDPADSVPLCG